MTHLQNVLCLIRTSVVLILDDMIVKDIYIESKQHKDFIKLTQSSRSIANYCVENQTKNNLEMQIVKAEAITCEIITDNNLSLSTANPLSRSFKVMFPDSKIAAGMFTSFSFLNTCSNILSQDY